MNSLIAKSGSISATGAPVIQVRGLGFYYRLAGARVEILKDLDFTIARGDFVAIQGPSGSGKSTLFHILGCMLRAQEGEYLFAGERVPNANSPTERSGAATRTESAGRAMRVESAGKANDRLALIRNRRIGFVFQQFHLLPRATVLENILLPSQYPAEAPARTPQAAETRARELAVRVGLGEHLAHRPNQLSGGQQQRVAIARALMNDVDLLLADEPTGNLDSRNAEQVMRLLAELNAQGMTIVLITHDGEVAARCKRALHLRDGRLVADSAAPRGASPNAGLSAAAEPAAQGGRAAAFGADEISAADAGAVSRVRQYLRILRAVFPLVGANLLRNKAKSALTMLGVVIGVAAVLAMATLGEYAKVRILESYQTLGVNQLLIRGYRNWQLKATDRVTVNFNGFEMARDLEPLSKVFPEVTMLSPVATSWQGSVTARGTTVSEGVRLYGVDQPYLSITNRELSMGKNFNAYQINQKSPVCVLGSEIVDQLYGRSIALGQIVTVVSYNQVAFPCRVIGVLAPTSSKDESARPNLQVWMPYTYFLTNTNYWGRSINNVALQVAADADVEDAGKKIKAFFEKRYGKSGQFYLDSDSTLIAQMKRFLNVFQALLAAIAFLSLLVGGIGINNMMLVSVAERVKEFGLRKALGATDRSIRVQVLAESALLCGIAGLIGVALGFAAYEALIFAASKLIATLPFEWVIEPVAAGVSLVSIVVVGILSGLVPAVRAERLEVIEALRSE